MCTCMRPGCVSVGGRCTYLSDASECIVYVGHQGVCKQNLRVWVCWMPGCVYIGCEGVYIYRIPGYPGMDT